MQSAQRFHIRRILAPTDFSACSDASADYALALARALGAEVQFCHCSMLPDEHTAGMVSPAMKTAALDLVARVKAMVEATREHLDAWVDARRAAGVPVSAALIEGYPDEGIASQARAFGADLIVIGSHGRRGIRRALLGSVAERVMREAPCPVLVVHAPPAP